MLKQECIPVECVPSAAVAVSRRVCLSACWDIPPNRCGPGDPPGCQLGTPLGVGMETPLDVGLETPPSQTHQAPPWVCAWILSRG